MPNTRCQTPDARNCSKSVKEQIEKKLIEQQIEILLDDWLESERQNSSIQDFSQFEER